MHYSNRLLCIIYAEKRDVNAGCFHRADDTYLDMPVRATHLCPATAALTCPLKHAITAAFIVAAQYRQIKLSAARVHGSKVSSLHDLCVIVLSTKAITCLACHSVSNHNCYLFSLEPVCSTVFVSAFIHDVTIKAFSTYMYIHARPETAVLYTYPVISTRFIFKVNTTNLKSTTVYDTCFRTFIGKCKVSH